jgi:hypothetical protein
MKKTWLVVLLGLFLLVGKAQAAMGLASYIIYTAETLPKTNIDVSWNVPGNTYLYPHVITLQDAESKAWYTSLLGQLAVFKPKLYAGATIMDPAPKDGADPQFVLVKITVNNEEDFKTVMSEVVYTFAACGFYDQNVSVLFHFTDTTLEEKYGGVKYSEADVPYSVFALKHPTASGQ